MQLSKIFLCAVGIVALSITTTMAKTVRYSCGEHDVQLSSDGCSSDISINVSCSESGITTSVSGDNIVSSCSGNACTVTSVLCCPKGQVKVSDGSCCDDAYDYVDSQGNKQCCGIALRGGICCNGALDGKTVDGAENVNCCPDDKKNLLGEVGSKICCPNADDTNVNGSCCTKTQTTTDKTVCCPNDEMPAKAPNSSKCCKGQDQINCQGAAQGQPNTWDDVNCECKCPDGQTKVADGSCCDNAKVAGSLVKICCKGTGEIPATGGYARCCKESDKTDCEKQGSDEPHVWNGDDCSCNCESGKTECNGRCYDTNCGTDKEWEQASCSCICSGGKVNTDDGCCDSDKVAGNKCCKEGETVTGNVGSEKCCKDERVYTDSNDVSQCCDHELTNGVCCDPNNEGKDVDGNWNEKCCPSEKTNLITDSSNSDNKICCANSTDVYVNGICCTSDKVTKDGNKCCLDTETPATAANSSLCCNDSAKTACEYANKTWNSDDCTCGCPKDAPTVCGDKCCLTCNATGNDCCDSDKIYDTDKCCDHNLTDGVCCSTETKGKDVDGKWNAKCCGHDLTDGVCCSTETEGKDAEGNWNEKCCPEGKKTLVGDDNNKICCSKYRAFDNNQRCCPHELTYDGACCKDTYPTPMGGKDIDENYDVRCCPSNQKKLVSNSNGSTTMCCPNDSADTLIWNNCCPANRATKDGSKCCDMGQLAATAEGSSKCCYEVSKTYCESEGRKWHDEDCTCECPEDRKYGTDKCCGYELESGICCERGVSGNRTGNDADGNQSQTCCESAGGSWKNSICCSKENPGKTFGGTTDSRCPICSNGKTPIAITDLGSDMQKIGESNCNDPYPIDTNDDSLNAAHVTDRGLCCKNTIPPGVLKNNACCLSKTCLCEAQSGSMENGVCCPLS